MRRIFVYVVVGLIVGAAGLGGAFLLYDDAVRSATFTTTQTGDGVNGNLYYYDQLRDDRQQFFDRTLNGSVTTTPTDTTITGYVLKDGTLYTVTQQTNWLSFIGFSISGGLGILGVAISIASVSLVLFDWRYDAIESDEDD